MAHEMREFERIKEKVVIRLDGRQVAWLVIGCIVISGAVFAAGYQMGNMAGGGASIHEGLTIVAPAPAQVAQPAPEAAPKEPEQVYTYDRELVKPTPPVAVEDPALKLLAERRAEVLAAETGPIPADEPPPLHANSAFAGGQLPAGPGAGGVPAGDPAEADDDAESDLEAALDSGNEEAIEIARANVPVRAPEPVATDKPAQPIDAEPRGVVRGPDGQAVDTSKDGNWTIQIKAFKTRKDADAFVSLLREAGYKPYIVQADVAGKGRYYRVRLGTYASKREATRKKRDFEKAEGFATIITRL